MRCYLILLSLIVVHTHAQTTQNDYEIQEIKDIAYLPDQDIQVDSLQRINLLIPKEIKSPPLFMWIGGGAWSFVSRNIEMDLARQFAKRGIAVATVGHRLSKGSFRTNSRKNGVIHPAHIEDVAAAFNYLYQHSEKYGFDGQSIIVGGFSSGAHLAALLAMDQKYLARYKLKTDQIKAIIPVGGTYDINHYYDQFKNNTDQQTQRLAETHVMDVFGQDISLFSDASPVSYLESMKVPMLLISDNALRVYTDEFEKRLSESAYKQYQVHHVLDLNHQELWRDLSFEQESATRRLMIDYIKNL